MEGKGAGSTHETVRHASVTLAFYYLTMQFSVTHVSVLTEKKERGTSMHGMSGEKMDDESGKQGKRCTVKVTKTRVHPCWWGSNPGSVLSMNGQMKAR